MKNIFLLIFSIFAMAINAQNISNSFYEHYTGLISDELKITADLIKTDDSFSGFYYYEYEEEGFWISSNPIALDGHVNNDGSFVLNEFGGQTSYFSGHLETPKLIKGLWTNKMLDEDIEFTLKATYPTGSIPMNIVEDYQKSYFQQDTELPSAEIRFLLLFPKNIDKAVFNQLLLKIYYLAGYRGEISSKLNILSILKEKYNQQFQNALGNVEIDSFPDSFNWQKDIRMHVINNKGGLLCLQFDTFAKSGSGSGSLVRKYLVFDTNKNKVLEIKDIFSEKDLKNISQLIEKKLRHQYKLDSDQDLKSFGFFTNDIKPSNNFYIHPGGIGFYYNIYEIAPYSNGPTNLFIPFDDIKSLSISTEKWDFWKKNSD